MIEFKKPSDFPKGTLYNQLIDHISWDPRQRPDYVEIGHNCILTKYKRKG
jgi:hypothetical protein